MAHNGKTTATTWYAPQDGVIADRIINDSTWTSTSPSTTSASASCRATTREASPRNYVLIGGAANNNALLVREGQMKAIKPAVDKGDIKIAADQWARLAADGS